MSAWADGCVMTSIYKGVYLVPAVRSEATALIGEVSITGVVFSASSLPSCHKQLVAPFSPGRVGAPHCHAGPGRAVQGGGRSGPALTVLGSRAGCGWCRHTPVQGDSVRAGCPQSAEAAERATPVTWDGRWQMQIEVQQRTLGNAWLGGTGV